MRNTRIASSMEAYIIEFMSSSMVISCRGSYRESVANRRTKCHFRALTNVTATFANEAGSEAASPRAGTVLPETWCQTLHVLKPIRMLLAYCWNHSSPLLGSIVVRGMKQISYVNCEFPKWFWVPWAFCRPLLPSFVIVTQREAVRRLGLDWAVTVGLVALKTQCSPKVCPIVR